MIKKIKEIAYGYWWNCAACGVENAYGVTEAEAADKAEYHTKHNPKTNQAITKTKHPKNKNKQQHSYLRLYLLQSH